MTHIIKKRNVKLEDQTSERRNEGEVKLLEEEGVVRAIQVHCSCGKTAVVELEYDDMREAGPDSR